MLTLLVIVVLALLAITLLIVGKRVLKVSKTRPNDVDIKRSGYFVVLAGMVVAVITIVFTGFNSYYTQDPGEAVVVRSFTGSVVGQSTDSGLHFTLPWNSTESFDIRNQKLEMFSNSGGEGADGSALSVPLKGGANASVSITVIYSIDPNAVTSIYEKFKTQQGLRDNALKASLRDVVRNMTSGYEPLQVKQNRTQLGNDIQKDLEETWSEYGVTIDQVNLGDISLDPATEQAIAGVIAAQQEVEKSRAGLEKAEIDAEITKTGAQAQADSDQIIRCGANVTYETRQINGVDTNVAVVSPKSNDQCENRLNEQVLLTKYFDTLRAIGEKGNMVVVVPEGGATPIITLPSKQEPAPQGG